MATIDSGGSDSFGDGGRTPPEEIAPNVDSRCQLSVLGGFALAVEGDVRPALSSGSQRLLACLAVQGRTVARTQVAGLVWPGVSDESAGASLDTALLRLEHPVRHVVTATDAGLRLSDDVVVDLRHSQALAQRLVDRRAPLSEPDIGRPGVSALSSELLPGWYDDWALIAAENWHRLRVQALEAAAERLTAAGRHAEAATAARVAISAEPLRESARASLIRVHLAGGRRADASEELARYRDLLNAELGVEPTRRLTQLLD